MRVPRHRLIAFAFAVVVLGWSVVEALTAGEMGLLYLAPALLLFLPLIFGRYVGEQRIAALACRPTASRRRPTDRVGAPRAAARLMHRGGRLVASSLAKRPPPARSRHLLA